MTQNNRQKIIALCVTLVVHLIVLGLLLLCTMKLVPKETTEINLVLVNYGTTDEFVAGQEEPARGNVADNEKIQETTTSAENSNPKSQSETNKRPINTQANSQAPAIKQEKTTDRQKEKAEEARKKAQEAAIRQQQANEAKKKEQQRQIGQDVAGAFGRGKNKSESQGFGTSGKGNQGSRTGSGDSYSLEGRSIIGNGGRPIRPNYAQAIRGAIRIKIEVNAQGTVVKAWVDISGTNISDSGMRNAAIQAAKQTKFNSLPGAANQVGSITYHYDVK
ncbi:energy transducer TonB family protein [Falsiporphyromonas endometrii]